MSARRSMSSVGDGAPVLPNSDSGKSPFVEHAETAQRLELAKQKKSKTEQELNSLVRVRSVTPNLSRHEIQLKDQQIMEMQQQLSNMNIQIQEFVGQLRQAEQTIRQQQATIKTQSKQIERPRPNHGSMSEPRRQQQESRFNGPPPQQFGPPPSFHPSFNQNGNHQQQPQHSSIYGPNGGYQNYQKEAINNFSAPQYAKGNVGHTQSFDRPLQSRQVNDAGSPEPVRSTYPVTPVNRIYSSAGNNYSPDLPNPVNRDPFSAHSSPDPGPQQFNNQSLPLRPYPNNKAANDQNALVPHPSTAVIPGGGMITSPPDFSMDAQITDSLAKLFTRAKDYAQKHANFAGTAGDNALPDELKQRILRSATNNTAFPLMKTTKTRYWVVAKVIIQWLLKHIFRVNTFSGLDANVDKLVDGTKNSIYQSTPMQLRFLMNNTIANHVKTITTHPQFQEYVQHLTNQRANQLYWIVRPMAHQVTMNDKEDMAELITEAHQLAQMIYTGSDEYSFTFCEYGERFDRYKMINVDPKYAGCSDDQMRNRWATVRLGATPIVSLRKLNPQGRVSEMTVLKSQVLLKIKGDD